MFKRKMPTGTEKNYKSTSILIYTAIAAMLLLTTVISQSCDENPNRKHRVSNVLKLRQLVQKTETQKTSSASVLLFFASYHSSETNRDYVKMFANVQGNYRLIAAPIENIRVVLVDTLNTPFVKIKYFGEEHTDEEICNYIGILKRCRFIIYCPEKYFPEKLLPISL